MVEIYSFNKKLKEHKEEEIEKVISSKGRVWIDYLNPTKDRIQKLSGYVDLHPITMEDIITEQTRQKYEEFNEYAVVVLKGVTKIKKDGIKYYKVFFIISEDILITVHKGSPDIFRFVKENPKLIEELLKKGVDYLLHHLIDIEIDKYFPIIDNLYEDIEDLNDELFKNNDLDTSYIFDKKRITQKLKKILTPTTDVITKMIRPNNFFISDEVVVYCRDVHDHLIRVNETLSDCTDQINTILSEQLTVSSNKLNDIMKILTIFSVIMLPLTLLSGVYGMNIILPYQHDPNAFWIVSSIMVGIVGVMLIFFKKKKWI